LHVWIFFFIKLSLHAWEVWIPGAIIKPSVDNYWELCSMSWYSKKKWGKYMNFIRNVLLSLWLNFVKVLKSFSNKYRNSKMFYITLWKPFCAEIRRRSKFSVKLGMTPVQTRDLLKLNECARTVSRTLIYLSHKQIIDIVLYESEKKVLDGCRFSQKK
jgi:predicted transcriptional regulator